MNSRRSHSDELIDRTKQFALRVVKMYAALPNNTVAQTLGKQALRSGTSVGAHCREARRARSTAEFASKLSGALQEIDETAYWLELLVESEIVPQSRMSSLCQETDELTAILTTVVKKQRIRNS
jgi:four helix bundle protein